ncbi:XRE family transcriptional regulator [Methylobacterium sp. XJLW]|uniref:helix-turn-helix domain-containing protein n=1 Tax=Methylobacterium sp. XJLW TaxID=739141 RepID=UPI000DAAE4BB|nr:helix-turn-helix transcriptional regulator [Methylobacterium sp. XJLW]AWV18248.1 XRE family transcriptional regulator [Methylobacterium sp. XJLW]
MSPSHQIASVVARLRAELGVTQKVVADEAKLDQSRVSRLEKGEVLSATEVKSILNALAALGSMHAMDFKAFLEREWQHVEPPSFWNPQRGYLEQADEVLDNVALFLSESEHPWPVRRHIERHRDLLLSATSFLTRLNHNIAFIGNIGVGKSTAISFLFDLLVPATTVTNPLKRTVLETGAGGTTICEVHIKKGPEFGVTVVPLSDVEMRQRISDFCNVTWNSVYSDAQDPAGEIARVSKEMDRALRNMAQLNRRTDTGTGKKVTSDPAADLARSCESEAEFRARVIERMQLPERTRRELWYDSATHKHPMEWVKEVFSQINKGQIGDVPLPETIDLLVPNFGKSFGDLELTLIDTKGVEDHAVREDLEARLKDPRTAVVFCSGFNDAPGPTTGALLKHMRETFAEGFDPGKAAILALPLSGQATAMKNDVGDEAESDAEGYELKEAQIAEKLTAEGVKALPVMFFNVISDEPVAVRENVVEQLMRMRQRGADHLLDLCAAIEDLMENIEQQAIQLAIEEVSKRLSTFLQANRRLGARERLPYVDVMSTLRGIRYASTLWAASRRNGEYSGLNIVHMMGSGAARDARSRCDGWFKALDAFLNSLKADDDLAQAGRTIDQIRVSAAASKTTFLDTVQQTGMEVYREPLRQSPVWQQCAAEWGKGSGFKDRVAKHLEDWFQAEKQHLDKVEEGVTASWEKQVIAPLMRLADESAPQESGAGAYSNVVAFPSRAAG